MKLGRLITKAGIKREFKKQHDGRTPSTKRLRALETKYLEAKRVHAVALVRLQQERDLHFSFAGMCAGVRLAQGGGTVT